MRQRRLQQRSFQKRGPLDFMRHRLGRVAVCLLFGLLMFTAIAALRMTMTTPKVVDSAMSEMPIADHQRWVVSALNLDRAKDNVDPIAGGWVSEELADDAKRILLQLLETLNPEHPIDEAELQAIVDDQFQCTALFPDRTKVVFEDDVLVVLTSSLDSHDEAIDSVWQHQGLQGLSEALESLASTFSNATSVHSHVKVVRVAPEGNGSWTTQALVESTGKIDQGVREQHSVWACEWVETKARLQLKSIAVSEFQQSTSSDAWFKDGTASVFSNASQATAQLGLGLNHWLRRIERARGIHVFSRCGVAVGDVNADGRDDLYVCQPGGLPNQLLLQNSDGTVANVASAWNCDWLDHTSSALVVDLDNDSDQDLVLATTAGLVIMEHDGDGHFKIRKRLSTSDTDVQSLVAADYDNDGDLDLYLCIDFARRANREAEFVYHDANDGGRNVMIRNETTGDRWQFVDVTDECGLDVHNRRHSLAAAWEDYDNDGDQDLYVANDYGQNCLYRNNEGRFEEIAADVGVVDFGSGMSASWGDYDRNGWMDLYVGNMFSSAGNRVTRQSRFKSDEDAQTRNTYSRFAKGNSLFRNGGKSFTETGSQAGVEMARWAWSSLFADLNNDGWQDLVVANGYITTEDSGDL